MANKTFWAVAILGVVGLGLGAVHVNVTATPPGAWAAAPASKGTGVPAPAASADTTTDHDGDATDGATQDGATADVSDDDDTPTFAYVRNAGGRFICLGHSMGFVRTMESGIWLDMVDPATGQDDWQQMGETPYVLKFEMDSRLVDVACLAPRHGSAPVTTPAKSTPEPSRPAARH